MHMTHHSCPFITFKNSMTALAYYMDKGDTITIWAQIVYREGQGVYVMLLTNNKHLLVIYQRSHSKMMPEVGTINTVRQTLEMFPNQPVPRTRFDTNLIVFKCLHMYHDE